MVQDGCGSNDWQRHDSRQSIPISDMVCSLQQNSGPCFAYDPRWYHVNGLCQEFVCGGCGGYRNNFQTRDECERKCIVCNLPAETGPCRAAFKRWYYDNGVCKTFTYGRCAGNDNRLESTHACKKACTIERNYS
ncbi:carboxypeptidase inhibitor SmCI-like [Dreissena polymorpha]|uniref:carboxypeptidase inhibitor SmCI-like n=1 Tax=Dreissena polymorpha TaxID=45954 RepID=UPI00226480AE|nr:carboxypeptidase inhibitor SmCI-like [Dreissena polymorpha]